MRFEQIALLLGSKVRDEFRDEGGLMMMLIWGDDDREFCKIKVVMMAVMQAQSQDTNTAWRCQG